MFIKRTAWSPKNHPIYKAVTGISASVSQAQTICQTQNKNHMELTQSYILCITSHINHSVVILHCSINNAAYNNNHTRAGIGNQKIMC